MIEQQNLNALVEYAMRDVGHQHMRPVIIKELLHYDILFALEDQGLLDTLTFQGGTSLRLCYGSDRFSEDLDFAGGKDFSENNMLAIKECLENYIGKRYNLEIEVKEPSNLTALSEDSGIKVGKWQVKITTEPEKKHMPKQRIKLEIANVPAYSRTAQSLQQNYNFLPDGYDNLIIMTESLDEIMADKIISFVSCQRYIRYRDIWDIRWLKQQGATLNNKYIAFKIKDYHETNYSSKLLNTLDNLENIIRSDNFYNEMSRFLPIEVQNQTLKKDKFIEFLISETQEIFEQVKSIS